MSDPGFRRRLVGVCAVIAILAGCGGSQAQFGAPATTQQGAATLGHPGPAELGMSHPAATGSKFTVSGRFIELNGEKFYVKGMDYWPTPIGTTPWEPPGRDSPLRDDNSAIWLRDLPRMRATGVNAIHVYNVVGPPYDDQYHVGPISAFLDAAWNNGNHPIYVLISIFFDYKKLKNINDINSLVDQYYDLDYRYAHFPAVMGVAIGNEIAQGPVWKDAAWWAAFNRVAESAKKGFAAAGYPDKIVTTPVHDAVICLSGSTEVDCGKAGSVRHLAAIYYGELHGAKVNVWGDNPYRGRTMTDLYEEIRRDTPKPVFLTEYGATAAYHVDWKNTYSYPHDLHGVGSCSPTERNGPVNRDVLQLPASGSANPNMAGLVDVVTNNNKLLYDGYKKDGVVSGGFYLEWTDEWWKATHSIKYKDEHVGDEAFAGHFPGCSYDEAWWGLNGVSRGPNFVDNLHPRPTLGALKTIWANQP